MFYLTTHSTHFIYGYMASDHSDSDKGNPLPPHRLLFPISSKGSIICTILCYTSRGALAGTRNSSMGSPHEGSIRRPIAPSANALTTELHLAPCDLNYNVSNDPSIKDTLPSKDRCSRGAKKAEQNAI